MAKKDMPLASKSKPSGAARHTNAHRNAHGSHQGDNAKNCDMAGSDCCDMNGC